MLEEYLKDFAYQNKYIKYINICKYINYIKQKNCCTWITYFSSLFTQSVNYLLASKFMIA